MPFMKHIIEPINISQCPLPPGEPNELECLSNLTLANVIRQLSSLGQHAGRIFDELVQDAVKLNNRSQILSQRIENLKQKCSQLDIQNEIVSLNDLQTKKQFRNMIKIDQQVVSRKTMPEAMRLMYENADPPPALDLLNPYRTDGKDCMKFYTDPEFFFNIWCNELIKDNEHRKNEKKKRKTRGDKHNVKSPLNPKEQSQLIYQQHLLQQQQIQQNGLINENKQFNLGSNMIQNQQQIYQQQIIQLENQKSYFNNNDLTDQSLPPPPHQLLQPDINNFQIYSESNQYNNGNHSNKIIVQQARLTQQQYSNERPILPPPPVPDSTQLSDLQQIQQQMIRKYDRSALNHLHEDQNQLADLPPPPSPPNFHSEQAKLVTNTMTLQMTNLTINQKTNIDTPDSVLDMPLPPPPIELQDHSIDKITSPKMNNTHPPLPPPPPLPPLVESDTASSSTSSLSTSNMVNNGNSISTNKLKPNQEETKSNRSFLDDINKGRFVLKPTQKDSGSDDKRKVNSINEDSGRESIQPFVNNSDVAAIIDFVRKFRPHVQDSSDDDENSDWDE